MHWIETKDTSNSLAHAYNKIRYRASGVKLSKPVQDMTLDT